MFENNDVYFIFRVLDYDVYSSHDAIGKVLGDIVWWLKKKKNLNNMFASIKFLFFIELVCLVL